MKRILLDQNVPRKLARQLSPYHVETAYERGWSTLTNGELATAAESVGFDFIATADQDFKHQQSRWHRRISVIVLDTNRWRWIEQRVPAILDAIGTVPVGSSVTIYCFGPRPQRK